MLRTEKWLHLCLFRCPLPSGAPDPAALSFRLLTLPTLCPLLLESPEEASELSSSCARPLWSLPGVCIFLAFLLMSWFPHLPVLASCWAGGVLSGPVLSISVWSHPVMSGPALPCPVLSGPVLSCPVLSCHILTCPVWFCPVQFGPVWSLLRFPGHTQGELKGLVTRQILGTWQSTHYFVRHVYYQ